MCPQQNGRHFADDIFQMHFRKIICFILIRLLSVKWTTCVIIEVIAWCQIGQYLSWLWLGSTTPYDVTCAQIVYWCYDWSFILTAGIYPNVISNSNDSIISSYLHVNHALSKNIRNWPSSNRISFYTRELRHVLVIVKIKSIWIIFFQIYNRRIRDRWCDILIIQEGPVDNSLSICRSWWRVKLHLYGNLKKSPIHFAVAVSRWT